MLLALETNLRSQRKEVMKRLVTHTPEEILADYKPTRSSGRVSFSLVGLLIGLLFFGTWLLSQRLMGHQTQIERFPDYCQSCWEWPGFGPKPGQWTLDQLKCRIYRDGNLHHQYDRAIRKAHWYPAGKPEAIAYTPLYSSSPFAVIALPAVILLLGTLAGLLYGLYRDKKYERALRGPGVYVDGSMLVDIQTYNQFNQGDGIQYYVEPRQDGKRIAYL
jgi:hypothetical protein